MIGAQVTDTAGVADAVHRDAGGRRRGLDAFIAEHLGPPTGGPASASWSDSSGRAGEDLTPPVLPFRAMSATSEAPAAYRNTAGDPGAIGLIREAIADVRSRRRLVRYLVAADMHKRGADTLLGNFWWVLDPLLQMVVYVVLVTLIARGHGIEHYPLFIFAAILPWKWFTASVTDATTSVASQDRLIKQIQFPKIVLPVAATTAGVVGFAFGPHPVGRADPAARSAASRRTCCSCRSSPRSSSCSPWPFALLVSAGNVFFRDLGNVAAPRPAAVVLPVARAVQPGRARGGQPARPVPDPAHAPRAQPVRHPVRGLPGGHLGRAGDGAPTTAGLAVAARPAGRRQHRLPGARRRSSSSASSRSFAKVL